ncbi:hypothetical protein [Amycolatopsis sp. H20-H5]|uniref:hypothetical protein n=1 Tax=Amycolatopsis sp. H20-H5 TaxID=3046309 RepID=UPI002DBC83C5|nr:hypothetical protein [Amycolatopsis sp. H20-H5]MEC3975089.1 hypothetical protein [Amycolatopsis sp. H20-H5]
MTIGGTSFECQLNSWNLDPGTDDGDRQYTFCPDGTFIEETDDEPTLELKFFSDWRSAGISDFLWSNPNVVASFLLDHHPEIVGEHVRFTGQVLIKPAPVGGDARDTEMTEITLQVIGTLGNGLTYERI